MLEALPAVTVPLGSKTGFSRASFSTVLSRRTVSSRSNGAVPPLTLISTGTICPLKYPLSMALPARRWLSAASLSWASRETLYFLATFSAVTPM